MNINPQIIDAIQKNKLVFFIGSGFSKPLGFPNWSELIVEFLKDLSQYDPKYNQMIEVLKNKFFTEIEVLEKIKDKKREIFGVLNRVFDGQFSDLSKLSAHEKIGKISEKIITTNYDRALETATGFKKIQFDNNYHIANLSNLSNYIFKLHGCIEDPGKCILFKDDYEDLYGNNGAAIERLKTIISDQTIIFIGFSFSDPYVKQQFEYISTVYKGLTGNHYIVTTENEGFEEYGVESIKIMDWESGLTSFLDSLLVQKDSFSRVSASVTEEIDNIEKIQFDTGLMKVAILIASPIDIACGFSFDKIVNHFSKFEMQVDLYYLSEENLRDLEEYDYIFIFTKLMQNKHVVEDVYLKSKFMTLEEIEQNLVLYEKLKGVFIYTDKAPKKNQEIVTYPIVRVWGTDLSSLIFKVFRKGKIDEIENCIIYNPNKIIIMKAEKGKAKINIKNGQDKSKLSEFIDSKNLISFVGRTTDLEDIIRKVLETNERILTIKGSGGIGKTTIIKKAAIEMFNRNHFRDGIYFIDCEFIDNYKTFEYKIAQCFGLDSSINLKEHVIQNQMKMNALIILDNFEPMLYIEQSEQIKDIINFICEYSVVVVTSREWIGFEYEQRHELRAFTSEEALELFQTFYLSPISDFDLKILKEDILGDLLNNNPLAIKIVARVIPKGKNLPILKTELVDDFFNITDSEYTDIFDGLTDKNIERSKSLFQSISYSYKRLTSKEKILFEILSLFPDGIHMQNIKTFFEKDEFKMDKNKITDKEINGLENKSLIEINKGFIKLQSILGRFAEYQFNNRTAEEKSGYYKRAFQLNEVLIMFLSNFSEENRKNTLLIFDKNSENFLKNISYIDKFEEDKMRKILFIESLVFFFSKIEHTENLCVELNKVKNHFDNIVNGKLYIDIITEGSRYYRGYFEESYMFLNELLPIDKLRSIDLSSEIGFLLIKHALAVYRYKNGYSIIEYLIDTNFYEYRTRIMEELLFSLGEYKLMMSVNREIDFFTFEVSLNLGTLNISELDEFINSLYKKEYMEIMQTNYIKAKWGFVDNETINKLVVTNPYTLGLKSLMQAFIENDEDKAVKFYKKAIEKLEHISYYYVEAIYFYTKYLRDINSSEMNDWFNKGLILAKEHKYKFQVFQFNSLINSVKQKYDDDLMDFPLKTQAEWYLHEYKERYIH
ncbi:SIR2 family protein [Paenibacillus sp. FSL H8-0537]|uniref:SIR2 family protein n=1 Tax=Paenibacillus sp. FSL H8-0537 TaxID=2921399 RepID=UPI003100E6CE